LRWAEFRLGELSQFSRPAVPCPATICGSSKLGTTTGTLSAAMRGDSSRLWSAVVKDDFGALRLVLTFSCGAPAGMTMVAAIPSRLAAMATPWA
jgi:hypothetical protein